MPAASAGGNSSGREAAARSKKSAAVASPPSTSAKCSTEAKAWHKEAHNSGSKATRTARSGAWLGKGSQSSPKRLAKNRSIAVVADTAEEAGNATGTKDAQRQSRAVLPSILGRNWSPHAPPHTVPAGGGRRLSANNSNIAANNEGVEATASCRANRVSSVVWRFAATSSATCAASHGGHRMPSAMALSACSCTVGASCWATLLASKDKISGNKPGRAVAAAWSAAEAASAG
mmetsp:Transcript_99451/g.285692  ORF Transcript_99451/g.285692 Transcript_99451/m.285692 type:complete len:232 (+) Transcript_99451:546-1241(+)